MKELKRICWDCPGEPVETWEVKKNQNRREGCLFTIACKQCKKESQVFGWMIGCDCQTCKDQSIGAAK
ncbi:hypothetical protein CL660_003225 [bacterium]|nr:hypothetical protein [bacterium]|tara:strand:+ start:68838 stop:69041 length:204 start_codon:yes stop_codon:yes gene_type:complete